MLIKFLLYSRNKKKIYPKKHHWLIHCNLQFPVKLHRRLHCSMQSMRAHIANEIYDSCSEHTLNT